MDTQNKTTTLKELKSMNYEEAKKHKEYLDTINRQHSEELQNFPQNELGLVPNHIRESDEFKQAKKNFDESFKQLRIFNSYFVKTFKRKGRR